MFQNLKLKHLQQFPMDFKLKLTLSKYSYLHLHIKENKERLKNIGEPKRSQSYLRLVAVPCAKKPEGVIALETDLRKTKKVYGAAYTKRIKKVKKLEQTVKTSQVRRRADIVVSD
ncbi:hypothetical protein Tco_1271900, partial [Tanacetum coccineum]